MDPAPGGHIQYWGGGLLWYSHSHSPQEGWCVGHWSSNREGVRKNGDTGALGSRSSKEGLWNIRWSFSLGEGPPGRGWRSQRARPQTAGLNLAWAPRAGKLGVTQKGAQRQGGVVWAGLGRCGRRAKASWMEVREGTADHAI